jgi:type 1 glutamine amidotransferase
MKTYPLNLRLPWRFGVLALALLFLAAGQSLARSAEPLRALLITGGCCHDYAAQKKILTEGISARANVVWTIVHEGGDSHDHMVSVYQKPDWAKGYDVVVHNECFGAISNVAFVDRIASAHTNGVAAVVIHCSIHSYRFAHTDEWRKVLGVSSFSHEGNRTFDVVNVKPENPIMAGFPSKWSDPHDELYRITKLWPNCVPLAKGIGVKGEEHVCVWANTCGKGRVFGTTLGHGDGTMQDPVYLDLVSRGLLWACGKLGEDGKPLPGYGPAKP